MARRPPTTLQLEQFLPYRLVSLAQGISTALSAIYREEFGISAAEWRVLANLAEMGELNPKDVALQTAMDKAKVSRAIKELSARRLVIKRRDDGDNRAYRLRLSDKGLVLYGKIVPLALSWEGRLLDALDASEYRDLLRIIDKLSRRIEAGVAIDDRGLSR